jgi:predicted DNA-binding transcriptional regulator AlpA
MHSCTEPTLNRNASIEATAKPQAARPAEKPITSPLLNAAQAAALLGVSSRKFHALRDEAWFPQPVVLGARVRRYIRDELIEAATSRAPRAAKAAEPEPLRRQREERAAKGAA